MDEQKTYCVFSWVDRYTSEVYCTTMAMRREEFEPLRKAMETYATRHFDELARAGIRDFAFIEYQPDLATPPLDLLASLRAEDHAIDDPDEGPQARAAWTALQRRAEDLAVPPESQEDTVKVSLRFVWGSEQLFEDAIRVPASRAATAQAWLQDMCDQLEEDGSDVDEVEAYIDTARPRSRRLASAVRAIDGLLRDTLHRTSLPGADPGIAALLAATRQASILSAPTAKPRRRRA